MEKIDVLLFLTWIYSVPHSSVPNSTSRVEALKVVRVLMRMFGAGVHEALAVPVLVSLLTHVRSISAASAPRTTDSLVRMCV